MISKIKIGAPSTRKEKCKYCEKEFLVYRGGSWDWQPKACSDCKRAEFEKELYKNGKK